MATTKLSKKQVAQRKYASGMRGVRKRAAETRGGKGTVASRPRATKERRALRLKAT